MNLDNLSDASIETLITMPKTVVNPNAKWVENRGSKQINYELTAENYLFTLYLRQNTFDVEHFSCGLIVIKPDGQKLTLLRYNGSNHPHGDILYKCHIHKATAKAINANKLPESYAEETDRYTDLNGAFACLCEDAKVTGLTNFEAKQSDLFN